MYFINRYIIIPVYSLLSLQSNKSIRKYSESRIDENLCIYICESLFPPTNLEYSNCAIHKSIPVMRVRVFRWNVLCSMLRDI